MKYDVSKLKSMRVAAKLHSWKRPEDRPARKGHGWYGDPAGHAAAGRKGGQASAKARRALRYELLITVPGHNAETHFDVGTVFRRVRPLNATQLHYWKIDTQDGRRITAGSSMERMLNKAGEYPEYFKELA